MCEPLCLQMLLLFILVTAEQQTVVPASAELLCSLYSISIVCCRGSHCLDRLILRRESARAERRGAFGQSVRSLAFGWCIADVSWWFMAVISTTGIRETPAPLQSSRSPIRWHSVPCDYNAQGCFLFLCIQRECLKDLWIKLWCECGVLAILVLIIH